MGLCGLPSTRGRKSGTLRPTMSAPRKNTPATPMWLNSSKEGMNIYLHLGFKKKDNYLIYKNG